jgi:hypothetical protein
MLPPDEGCGEKCIHQMHNPPNPLPQCAVALIWHGV